MTVAILDPLFDLLGAHRDRSVVLCCARIVVGILYFLWTTDERDNQVSEYSIPDIFFPARRIPML